MNVPINFAAMSEHTWWWLARATGMVGWALATASIVWGLALSGRLLRRKKLPAWLLDLHRYLGTLTLAFVAVHMAALTLDHYVAFSLRDLLVPMASSWKPGAVAWGIAAFYVLVVIQLTSWGMKWLPRKVWHGIHFSSFFVFLAATVHGVTAGTDAAEPLVQMGAIVGTTLLITLVFLRVLNAMSSDDAPGGARATAAAARAARATAQDEAAGAAPTATPASGSTPSPAPRATGDAPLDPVLAARLARLGDRVGRSPQPSAAVGHAAVGHARGAEQPRRDGVGQVDEEGSAGLWAALEVEAVERVARDRRRAEERLRDLELGFTEDVHGEASPLSRP